MISVLSRLNPLRRSPSFRRIEEMEDKINKKETMVIGLENDIKERSSRTKRAATEIERTAEEVLANFENFRDKT